MDWAILEQWASGILASRWADALSTFLIILAVLVCNSILQRVLGAFGRRAENTKGFGWQAAVLGAAERPLRGAVWLLGLTVAVRILTYEDEYSLLSALFAPARDVGAIVLVGWFLLRLIGRIESNVAARARSEARTLDPTAADAIGKLVRAAVFITTGLLAMQALGFSIAGLLALGGAGGIAIGFAAQSLVANLLGGLTIYASRPFKVGEWIILPGTEVMGEVQEIGWRATRVMGFDRRPFYVPNALFNTAVVINHSRMTHRRIMEHIHIRHRDVDKVQAIVADVNAMLGAHPGIDHSFFAFNFDTYGDFSLKLLLYAFTLSTDYKEYLAVKEEVLIRIAAIVQTRGAEVALPTSTVHVPEGLRLNEQRPAGSEPFIAGLVEDPSRQI